jgi:uncharacterized protein (TIGR02271 family)
MKRRRHDNDRDRTQRDDGVLDGAFEHGEDGRAIEVVRAEEELRVSTESIPVGTVRLEKVVGTEHVEEVVERAIEHAEVERVPAQPGDSGVVETLPDGSISVPVLEERLVVEKRLVVRERIIVRKTRTAEPHLVEADLRREQVRVHTDPALADRVQAAPPDPSARRG